MPGGREVKVVEANKHEYVNLIARHRMTTSIKPQIQVIRDNRTPARLHELLGAATCRKFNVSFEITSYRCLLETSSVHLASTECIIWLRLLCEHIVAATGFPGGFLAAHSP